jgi:alpha-glucosidase
LVKDDQLRDNPPNPDYHPGLPPYDELLPVYTTDRPEVLDVLAGLRAVVDERRPDGLLLAEMYLPIERLMRYYGAVQLPSNMHLISVPYRAEDIGALISRYEAALPAGAWPNWVLGNHDRSRVASRVGAAQARVAAMLLLTLRGTPIVYYGDEIGMADVPVPDELVMDPFAKQVPGIGVGRDPARSPMRWAPGTHYGFCPPDVRPWLPMPGVTASSVAEQDGDAKSMLTLYRSLIALRRESPALTLGDHEQVRASDDVLAYRRGEFLIVLNLGDQQQIVDVDPGVVVLSTMLDRAWESIGLTLTLRADEGVVIRTEGAA